MILLPVIERELRVVARSRQAFRNRFLAALAVIGVSAWVFFEKRWQPQSTIGSEMFEAVSLTALVVSLLAGLFYTADCISEERREGTLGLLYLTDLKSGHVVMGKLVANSLPSFFALATIVPILGIPFLLGGVSPNELTRVALVLLNALWLSVAAGLFASTLAKDDRVTRLITFLIIIGTSVIAPIMGATQSSAFWVWDKSRDKNYGTAADDFWVAMSVQFAIPCVCVALAAWRARAIWQEKPPGVRRQSVIDKWRVWSTGAPAERKEWRTRLLDKNPALWLACRRRTRTALLWGLIGIGAVVLVWVHQKTQRIDSVLALLFSVFFHTLIKGTIAFAAGRGLADEARTGALELLFTTGLSPADLVRGHLSGLLRSFGLAAGLILFVDALWVATSPGDSIFTADFRTLLWIRVFFLVFDSVTIAFYAFWLGFKTQRSGRAAIRALIMVMILPDLFCLLPIGLLWRASDPYLSIFVFWTIFNAVLLTLATRPLGRLRRLASERFSSSSRPG